MTALRFLTLLTLLAVLAPSASAEPRRFEFSYDVRVPALAADGGALDLFLPIAQSDDQQRIVEQTLDSNVTGAYGKESVYGNRFWNARIAPGSGPTHVTVRYRVERTPFPRATLDGARSLSDGERTEYALFLGPNARVPIGDPVLDPILTEVRRTAGSDGPARTSRAIYDWVVDNVEYKKVGTGWGNGDTYWACSERYGNCTDFHALYISLARTESIPARFEIGFPVPDDRAEGEIGGYHCWLRFYLPGVGWIPIDASEASKRPEQRERYYASQPADRIRFTTGRDLRLGEAHRGPALNYFVYPYAELDGKPWSGQVERSFTFRSLDPVN